MKRVGVFITSCVIAVATLPAIAQQNPAPVNPGPSYGYGYGHMWGWHPGFIIGPIVMLLILVCLIALVALAARFFCHHCHGGHHGSSGCPFCGHGQGRASLDILEERFAKGEIDKTEFEEKRKLLGR
jgi:putative membrane protein